MRGRFRFVILWVSMAGMVALGLPAGAGHETDPRTNNMHPKGHIEEPAAFLGFGGGNPDIHTDLAFWGHLAFQGNWDGFNIRDISDPDNPTTISRTFCDGDQGDVAVWEDILVRSWNSNAPGTTSCDGDLVPEGFEGLHIFDISDLTNPDLVGSVDLDCGSHTTTLVPDLANDRVIVYSNNSSSSGCTPADGDDVDIVAIPLANPGSASLIGEATLQGPTTAGVATGCHDAAAILGDEDLLACASADTTNVFGISDPANPVHLFNIIEPGVGDLTQGSGRWHSAAFTWDGEVIILGWEPGGGTRPRCTAAGTTVPDVGGTTTTQTNTHKSLFFYDSDGPADDGTAAGTKVGTWVLPRNQTTAENCTLHNYNVVPLRSGRYVLVHGSYQSGTSVVDFTDPANAVELGWVDPPPLVPTQVGGAWSSYWYNNFIYESDITEGLNIFRLSGPETGGAMRLPHLNPLTQEFTIG